MDSAGFVRRRFVGGVLVEVTPKFYRINGSWVAERFMSVRWENSGATLGPERHNLSLSCRKGVPFRAKAMNGVTARESPSPAAAGFTLPIGYSSA